MDKGALAKTIKPLITEGYITKVCQFNKPVGLLHDMVRYTIKHMHMMNRLVLLMDDVMGYGRFISMDKKRFWEE